MRILLAMCLLSVIFLGGVAGAQERASYVQIEAHPSLREAQERARAYGGILSDINGFRMGGGWYGLALGPYADAEAAAILRRLRGDGLIPRDSYVTEGRIYGDRFWPAGLVAPPPAVDAPPVDAPADDEPLIAAPVEAPEETLREAQRSEAALNREEKKDLQRALQWFGHYTAAIDGSYGRGTRASMAAWQREAGLEETGVLTTRQRARLREDFAAGLAALGLGPIESREAGIAVTGPLGLVTFDRIEAPFVHYLSKDDSGVRLSLISQPGDRAALGGLYEILQTLDIVPSIGERSKERDGFRIRGEAPGRTTQVVARLEDGHVLGYILSWPPEQEVAATRALAAMDETLTSIGPPLDPERGFDAAAQSFDMVSGLQVRQPLRSASGFFVDGTGRAATAAATVAGCARVTLDRLHDAEVAFEGEGIAILRPLGTLAPVEVARLAPGEGRLRAPVSVGGYPYGGVLGAATLSFGTLEDVRGLDGSDDVLRLSLPARGGDVGGPVLDAAGRVAGLLLPPPDADGRALPADVAFAAKAGTLADVLRSAGVEVILEDRSVAIAPEDLTTRATGMTVLVSCWE